MNTKQFIIMLLFSLLSGISGAYFSSYQENNSETRMNQLEAEIIDKVQEASPSVVSIIIKKDLTIYRSDPWGFFQTPIGSVQKKVGGGTGFFITKDGIIITNKHVINDKNAVYTVITQTGDEYDAKILATDPLTDLAIIKIETTDDTIPLKFISEYKGIKSKIQVGQFVITIGNVLAEFQNSVSFGVISGTNRTIVADGEQLSGLLQTDAAINPGNSGGPLINLEGKVIGINTAIAGASQGIGFSIPLNTKKIKYLLDSIKNYGTIKKPFIGIQYTIISESIQKQLGVTVNYGALINGVLLESNASESGLKKGDIILQIDGKNVSLNNDIISIIQNKIPGDILGVKILKKSGEIKEVKIELGVEE
ncbi:trypsin-like serine protease [Candidatus Gracilibacteria bacterium 28_42_T64]|nr:trypsin-like serine protease [Candidatus Gracilibacteria bacterium 28_42_T64]